MKVKYPAEAFALGIVLFSAGMKESFAAGILVILATVFAEFLKNLLENTIPDWSLKACVFIGTASVSASAFNLGFSTMGMQVTAELWFLAFILGLFAAKFVLKADLQAEYGDLFWESGIVWGLWVLLGAARELMATGSIFGNFIFKNAMQSKTFSQVFFGFLTAGMVLAYTNGILKKRNADTHSLLVVLPIVLLARPFSMVSFGPVVGIIWTMIVPIVMFISVMKTLKFAKIGSAFRGLPCEMLSMGFIYMILSIY